MRNKGKPRDKMDQRLLAFGRENVQQPREAMVERTIQACLEIRSGQEADELKGEKLSHVQFFCMQVKMIQKRWWVLQGILLLLAWITLGSSETAESLQRVMSVAAVLFVILIMPELWKNRETNSMEIEKAAFYSLRQIYSAKLLAFGLVDACILNLFCFTAVNVQEIPTQELMKQFIFPLMVSTGICFAVFCSRRHFSEMTAMVSCAIGNGLWTLVVMNEAVYAKITSLLWGVLFAISAAVVFLSIRKTIRGCDTLWEVRENDINFG